jgi:NAD(P)-dependent dehydrogenase (short-subunit alcohol dehydrogenase family)
VDRTVLITGCSTDIGRVLATAFAGRDFEVCATARRLESIEDSHEEVWIDRSLSNIKRASPPGGGLAHESRENLEVWGGGFPVSNT